MDSASPPSEIRVYIFVEMKSWQKFVWNYEEHRTENILEKQE